ncbi:Phosphatidylglycerol specific phospholipase, partial [Aspergillus sclerotialis]
MGEGFIKGIYEALRASPQWDETLFILTFDEHGGFADHVPPPEGIPPGDNLTYTEEAGDGKPATFHFDRLGIRVPTVLISPWV